MSQTHTHSYVLSAVDGEIAVIERQLAKLHQIRRLVVEFDKARLPAAAAPEPPQAKPVRKPRKSKRQSPRLELTEILDVARDELGNGPTTIAGILKAASRHRTPHAVRVTEAALEQLGAVAVGKVRGGATAYALKGHNADEPEQAAVAENAAPANGLREAIAELARTAVGWNDEEFQYQLRKRCGIEASLTDVHQARLHPDGAAGRR